MKIAPGARSRVKGNLGLMIAVAASETVEVKEAVSSLICSAFRIDFSLGSEVRSRV